MPYIHQTYIFDETDEVEVGIQCEVFRGGALASLFRRARIAEVGVWRSTTRSGGGNK